MMATPQEDVGADGKALGGVAVAVTFQLDCKSECACPKFQQESKIKPPSSIRLNFLFVKFPCIFVLIHVEKYSGTKCMRLLLSYTNFLENNITSPQNQFFSKRKSILPQQQPSPLRCINPTTSPGPPEWRLPRLRHELLSSAAPATSPVRVHRGTPGVVDAAAAGEGYGGRSGQGGQGKGQGGMWWVEVGGIGWMMWVDMNQ